MSNDKNYGIHDWIYDFDEDLNLISVTRTYYPSYEAMEAAHKKFNENHPDIANRRREGLKQLFKRIDYNGLRAVQPSNESST